MIGETSVPRATRSGQLDEQCAPPGSDAKFHCSFCAKSQTGVRWLIAGSAAFICDECVPVCVDVLRSQIPGFSLDFWRTIDTAPRDGRQVLLWDGSDMCCAEFHTAADGTAWWELAHTGNKVTMLGREATHWQPLPEPPK